MITNVYVDGMNLFYGCLKGTPHKWLDLVALSKVLLPNDEIHRIRYFTAKVMTTPLNPLAHMRQEAYLRALRSTPEVVVHFGHFRRDRVRMAVVNPPPNTIEVFKTEEKESDVNLASYLLRDAFRRECEQQVVVTNDSDLCEPINIVRRELGMPVCIVNPGTPGRRTSRLRGDSYQQIRRADLAMSQLPPRVKYDGKIIAKPHEW